MRHLMMFIAFVLIAQAQLYAQEVPYDEKLAIKLGADDYGMKKYVMAFLLTGDNTSYTSEERAEFQKGHMENMSRLAEAGKLVMAGPFINGNEKRGILLFDVTSLEEAEELTKTDPAVQAGIFKMELVEWYGSATIVSLVGEHKKIQKKFF